MLFKKNNKGSTIVLVLVVMALVGIFATVALWISLNNFQMKITDQNVTDSFYSAEGVLDQISAGLQKDVSEAYVTAYSDLLENYTKYGSDDAARAQNFAVRYISELENKLKYNDGANPVINTCSLSLLRNYVSTGVTGSYEVYSADGNPNYCTTSISYDKDGYVKGLSVNGVCVDYTDADGYLSKIQTDILIQIPSMKIASVIEPPSISDYCLIGSSGIKASNTVGLSIVGSAYAGPTDGLTIDHSTVAFSAPTVSTTGSDYVVVEGNVNVTGTSDTTNVNLTTNTGVSLWANDILVNNAYAGLFGSTYARDDLILSGTAPMVSFYDENASVSSTYYGFGNGTTADDSSSVLLNGTDCSLNLNGLSSMVLCGYSFVGTADVSKYSTPTVSDIAAGSDSGALVSKQVDLMMGESISVKGDQIAYLVPTECIGVDVTSLSVGTRNYRNPMTYAEYAALKSQVDAGNKVFVSQDVYVSKVGAKLSSYTGAVGECYQTIFVPNGNGLVYFYLKLDGSNAEKYFKDYYKSDASKLLKYTDFYTKAITCTNTSIIRAPGTALTYEESESSKSITYVEGTSSTDSSKYQALYSALTKTLSTDSGKYSVINDDVFSTIIAYDRADTTKDVLYGFLGLNNTITEEYGNSRVVLTSLDNYMLTAEDCAKNTLIIATGNVTIAPGSGITSFTGSIIANGTINIANGANFTITPMGDSVLQNLLGCELANGDGEGAVTKLIYNFFREGEAYASYTGSGSTSSNHLSDLIVYQNWKKK